jgi:hypothetical protein
VDEDRWHGTTTGQDRWIANAFNSLSVGDLNCHCAARMCPHFTRRKFSQKVFAKMRIGMRLRKCKLRNDE